MPWCWIYCSFCCWLPAAPCQCCNVQRGLTPSQAAGGRAVLRAMLWCAVAGAAAAVLALRQPAAAGRRGARLALVLVALAFIAATYCARICLFCLFVVTAERSLLGFLVTLTVVLCTVYDDLLSFMSLLRGFGPEVEE